MDAVPNAALRWHQCATDEALQARVVELTAACARESLAHRSAFHIVLAGGSTPEAIYRRLARLDTPWMRWHVYFGDERCRPRGHPERNDVMADGAWLRHVPIPQAQRHYIPAEAGQAAVAAYAEVVSAVARFDLVLLGLGEDGHTASLFPGHDLGELPDAAEVLFVPDAPKPPRQRISLGARRLSRSRHCYFLISGPGKRSAVRAWRAGADIPARYISAEAGVDVFVTADANAGGLASARRGARPS